MCRTLCSGAELEWMQARISLSTGVLAALLASLVRTLLVHILSSHKLRHCQPAADFQPADLRQDGNTVDVLCRKRLKMGHGMIGATVRGSYAGEWALQHQRHLGASC